MFFRNDMIRLESKDRSFFMQQAIFTPSLGTLTNLAAQLVGNVSLRHLGGFLC
jgi:hypothetical protein